MELDVLALRQEKASLRGFFYFILLVIFYLAPLYFKDFYEHDIQRIAVIIFSILSFLIFVGYFLWKPVNSTILLVPLIIVVLLFFLYLHARLNEEYLQIAILFLTFYLFSRHYFIPSVYVLGGVISLCIVQVLLSISSLLGAIFTHEPILLNDLAVVYSNYRFLNHAQTAWIPILFVALYSLKLKKWGMAGIYVLLIFHAMLVVQMGARGTVLGLAGGFLVILFFFRSQAVATIKRFLIVTALAIALKSAVFNALIPTLGVRVEASNLPSRLKQVDQPRLQLWHRALVGMQRSPWYGHGPSSFAQYEQLQQDIHIEPHLAGVGFNGAHPHNIYLQIGYEYGIPAMLFFLAILGIFFKAMITSISRRGDLKDRQIGMFLLVGAVAVCLDGLFSGNFVMPVSQFWIAALFGLALKWLREVDSPATTLYIKNLKSGWGLVAIFTITCILQMTFIFPRVTYLNAYLENNEKSFYTGQRNPRFWSHAWF